MKQTKGKCHLVWGILRTHWQLISSRDSLEQLKCSFVGESIEGAIGASRVSKPKHEMKRFYLHK